jgi:hypothetical protein
MLVPSSSEHKPGGGGLVRVRWLSASVVLLVSVVAAVSGASALGTRSRQGKSLHRAGGLAEIPVLIQRGLTPHGTVAATSVAARSVGYYHTKTSVMSKTGARNSQYGGRTHWFASLRATLRDRSR